MGYDSTMSSTADDLSHVIDKQHLASPIKNLVDNYQLVPEFLKRLTYAAPIYVTIRYTTGSHGQTVESTKRNVIIGRMPIMLRSSCCVLYGKDEDELARLGECPLDPGGYFVIKGTEKVILIQEQLSKNRISIDTDEKVMKLYTQQQALEFLESDNMLKMPLYSTGPVEKGSQALSILRDIFLANVPVHQHNFRKKCIYVAVMMRRMMEAILNKDAMDDKDYVGNKRLELSGQLLSLLFEDLFKTLNDEARNTIDALLARPSRSSRLNKRLELSGQLLSLLFEDLFKTLNDEARNTIDALLARPSRSSRLDISQYIVKDYITKGLEKTLSTGNWDVK
ncbi:hypothetical protein P3S67_022288 [Capsicum chacoense]